MAYGLRFRPHFRYLEGTVDFPFCHAAKASQTTCLKVSPPPQEKEKKKRGTPGVKKQTAALKKQEGGPRQILFFFGWAF